MKHLTNEQYMQILHSHKFHGNHGDKIAIMRLWDEIRTDVNPNATWYELEGDEPKETDEYIKLDSVIDTLVDISRGLYSDSDLFEPIIETLLEAELRITKLPTIQIEKEVAE